MCNMPQAECATAHRAWRVMVWAQIIAIPVLAAACCASAASDSWQINQVFHSITPAGYEVLLLKPGPSVLTLLGVVDCPELEGARQISEGADARIVSATGRPLAYFPSRFSFRITATLRKTLLIDPTGAFITEEKPQDFLVKLNFRMKVYRGIEVRELKPDAVEMIGVPADVPYDERVYRVSFGVGDLLVTDRCVLEVLSPEGNRLAKFYFGLL